MRKLFLLITFFSATPLVFLLTLIVTLFMTYHQNPYTPGTVARAARVEYAALPSTENTVSAEVASTDARVELIRQFLARYNSPLEPDAQLIVDTADKYGLDFRLVPAIAMQESNLCKYEPKNSHNCWGFGIYKGHITTFASYEEAIDTVTKTLATKYKAKGLQTPEEIMTMYTPSSNGSWANGVSHFMEQLQ